MSGRKERPRRLLAAVGLLIALVVSQLPFRTWLGLGRGIEDRVTSEAIWWTIAGSMLAWVVLVERRSLASIGLRAPTWPTLGWAMAGTIAAMATVMLSYALILPALGLEANLAAASSITTLPLMLQLAIFVRAGVVEEILFRGYPIERLQELTGSKWIAALVPAAVFIGSHYAFWGSGQLIVVAMGTIVLTALYMWRRDLACCMIAHATTDLIGFTLARVQS
jgi:membrane protease YdiL (CAAX protease family)